MSVDLVVSALGQRLGTPGLRLGGGGTARLTAANGIAIDLECSPGSSVLHAYCVLRPMAGNTLQSWAPALLGAQLLGHDTAGASFMLDAQTGELLLGRSWDTATLAADADAVLADSVQTLAHTAATWRERLAGPRPALAPTEPDAAPPRAQPEGTLPEARSLGLPAFAIRG